MSTEDDKDETTVGQFPEDKDPKIKINKKNIIGGIVALVLVVIATSVFVLVQQKQQKQKQQAQPQPQEFQKVLGEHFKIGTNKATSNVNANTINITKPNLAAGKKIVSTEAKKSTGAEEKIIKELINQNKITQDKVQKNQSSLEQLKDNIGSSQRKQGQAIVSKINQQQQQWGARLLQRVTSLFKAKEQKTETPEMVNATFELVGINLWDSRPQATIRYDGKTSIIEVGSVRLNWKVMDINFDKEQITIVKNGQEVTLEKVK